MNIKKPFSPFWRSTGKHPTCASLISIQCENDKDLLDCDGGRYDETTGLCWQHPDVENSMYDWQEAVDYCDDLSLAGHTDWYLPSRQDFIELLEGCDDDVLEGSTDIVIHAKRAKPVPHSSRTRLLIGALKGTGRRQHMALTTRGLRISMTAIWKATISTLATTFAVCGDYTVAGIMPTQKIPSKRRSND